MQVAVSPPSTSIIPAHALGPVRGPLPFTYGTNPFATHKGTTQGATAGGSAAQAPRGPAISDVFHSFWSMRSGVHSSHSYLRNVKTRDLAFTVALILSAGIVVVVLIAAYRRAQADDTHVLAVGRFGKYYGTASVVYGVAVGAFLGVPYADPRTLRFGAPVPWYRERVLFDNRSPAPSCAQVSADLGEEFENGPFLELRVRAESDTHIVQTGSNNDPHYDGRALAALGDVVVVVPNWRLGVLGFFSLSQSDEVPINVGLLDQAESLRWTARNVDAFGGNKSDMVVVGHGSGASALGYHLMLGQGLNNIAPILKAVFMSESPMTRYPVTNRGQDSGPSEMSNASLRLLCEEAEMNNSSLLSCLRRLPVEELLRRQRADPRDLRFFPTLPVVWPAILWRELKIPRNVAVLVGFSEQEAQDLLYFFEQFFRLDEERNLRDVARTILTLLSFSSAEATAILNHYPEDAANTSWVGHLLSDLLVVCPVRFYAEYLRNSGNTVHGYVLERKIGEGQPSRDYAARLLLGSPLVLGTSSPTEQALSREVIVRWANFFKTGLFTPANVSLMVGETEMSMMSLTHPMATWEPDLRKEECEKLRPYFSAFMQ
ncbi:hypothetical protein HPB50_000991 [Hyalomma asiaticum]|uniref:Uncharacterized protein n=1 Tax=Hyalomma asiaticum TaxID=266040 RepID=A0ACB7SU49_HYAAI|nr:hypothetical protein HPB50_000991 [Hyalomma asiaticum]